MMQQEGATFKSLPATPATGITKIQQGNSPDRKAPMLLVNRYTLEKEEDVKLSLVTIKPQVKTGLKCFWKERNTEALPTQIWWRKNCLRYPIFSNVVRCNMAVRAKSTERDCDFSVACQVASKFRL